MGAVVRRVMEAPSVGMRKNDEGDGPADLSDCWTRKCFGLLMTGLNGE